jgi:hypothetical protein
MSYSLQSRSGRSRIPLGDEIREAANFVAHRALHVRVAFDRIPALAESLSRQRAAHWLDQAPVSFQDLSLDQRLTVSIIFNSISFCYWPDPWWDNSWYVSRVRRGSWALLAAIRHAIDNGVPILNASFLASISGDTLAGILGGTGTLTMVQRRAEILREVGTVLVRRFDNQVLKICELAQQDASSLLAVLLEIFPFFRDVAHYEGHATPFYKRAQLLVADIHYHLRHTRAEFHNLESLTACADYMLPAILERHQILAYSSALSEAISKREILPSGGHQEVELRAATVVAVDELARAAKSTAIAVNDALWLMAGATLAEDALHHRTITEAY